MGIINRFLLFLYALAVACLSLGVVALALQIVPEPILLNEYRYLLGVQQWQLVAGGILVFLLSIHLIGCSFSGGSDKREGGEFLVLHGKVGDVGVSLGEEGREGRGTALPSPRYRHRQGGECRRCF